MKNRMDLTRRSFVALSATALSATGLLRGAKSSVPIGLELYSVRNELQKNAEPLDAQAPSTRVEGMPVIPSAVETYGAR